jgi:hypothetical protein
LVLPPTAVHELHVIFTDGDGEAERALARTALNRLKQWGIRPFDLDSRQKPFAINLFAACSGNDTFRRTNLMMA